MSLEQDIRRLAQVELLGALEPEALGLLAFSSRKMRLRAGDRLYGAGESLDGALVILSGEIDLAAPGLPPRRVGPETTLGELALFTPLEAPGEARAAADAMVMRVTRETMGRVLEEFPAAAPATRARVAGQIARLASEARALEPL